MILTTLVGRLLIFGNEICNKRIPILYYTALEMECRNEMGITTRFVNRDGHFMRLVKQSSIRCSIINTFIQIAVLVYCAVSIILIYSQLAI